MQPCLIVIDYQQDFVAGPQGFPAARALEPILAERIRRYRAAGGAVLFTLDTGGSSTPLPPKPWAAPSTAGWSRKNSGRTSAL